MAATFWHILKIKHLQWPETEIKWIFWNMIWKIREIIVCKIFLADFSHLEPLWAGPYYTVFILDYIPPHTRFVALLPMPFPIPSHFLFSDSFLSVCPCHALLPSLFPSLGYFFSGHKLCRTLAGFHIWSLSISIWVFLPQSPGFPRRTQKFDFNFTFQFCQIVVTFLL